MRSKAIIKWIGIILGGLVVGLSGLVSLYQVAYHQKIYPSVRVGTIDISNLKIEEAYKKLEENLPTGMPMIELGFENQSWPIELVDLKYDPQSTAESAYLVGRSDGFLESLRIKWRLWFKNEKILMVYEVNEEVFNLAVDEVLRQIDQPAIEPVDQFA